MPELVEPGHEIVCGMIGMGKSYWLLYKIIKSLQYNRPCCYIDPKGDTYRSLLAFLCSTNQGREIWEQHRHRILLLNPVSVSDCIVGFNAIEPMGQFYTAKPDRVALLADNLTAHIRRQSGFEVNEAMRMQNILSASLGLLVEGGDGQYTLSEFPYLFLPPPKPGKYAPVPTYNAFVEALLPQVKHYGTASFWRLQWPTMLANDRRQWVQSSEGRIYPYLFDSRCLMTTCAVQSARLSFERLVNEGYWLFVNVPYPLLSEPITMLIGNLIITKIFYACMQRLPGSRPYRIILDEARFFNTGPLDRLLETSRAYNLWLTLVVQSLNQMCRSREGRMDESLKDIALSVVRYWSAFHMSQQDDAEELAAMMFPVTGEEIIGLRRSGDWERRPVAGTKELHARRFMDLGKRQVMLYDKLGGEQPRIFRTPDVLMDEPTQASIDQFEAQHLRHIGEPAEAILAEINGRRSEVQSRFGVKQTAQSTEERTLRRASFGGGQR